MLHLFFSWSEIIFVLYTTIVSLLILVIVSKELFHINSRLYHM